MYAILEIHSGETVKLDAEDEDGVVGTDPALFDSEMQAQIWLLARFGDQAGREYVVVRVEDT